MTVKDASSFLKIDAYRVESELLVILSGRLVLENCEASRNRLHSLVSPEITKYYVYMGHLDYVDSSGWGAMVGLKMANNRNRTQMCFLAPSERLLDIFRISKLDSIFDIKLGPEAEMIRTELERAESALFQDSKSGTPSPHQTVSNLTPAGPPSTSSGRSSGGSGDTEALSRDALEYLRAGDYQKAIDTYRKLLQISPGDLSALNNLGVIYEKRAEWYERAVETWKQVLSMSERANDTKHAERARRHLELIEKLRAA